MATLNGDSGSKHNAEKVFEVFNETHFNGKVVVVYERMLDGKRKRHEDFDPDNIDDFINNNNVRDYRLYPPDYPFAFVIQTLDVSDAKKIINDNRAYIEDKYNANSEGHLVIMDMHGGSSYLSVNLIHTTQNYDIEMIAKLFAEVLNRKFTFREVTVVLKRG